MGEKVSHVSFVNARAVHRVVKYLAGRCDGAQALDGEGFNKQDTWNGRMWALATRLTERQAMEAREMVRKYRRQIPDEMWRAMWR